MTTAVASKKWDSKLAGEAYRALLYALTLGLDAQLVYEVGVRRGHSTRAILKALVKTGGRLVSCDIEDCGAVVQDDALQSRWTFYHTSSERFATLLSIPADMIYVDGSHQYLDVRGDVVRLWPLLKPGGLMVLHDTDLPGPGRVLTKLSHRGLEVVELPFARGFGLIHKRAGVELAAS